MSITCYSFSSAKFFELPPRTQGMIGPDLVKGWMKQVDLYGSFQPKLFCDSMIFSLNSNFLHFSLQVSSFTNFSYGVWRSIFEGENNWNNPPCLTLAAVLRGLPLLPLSHFNLFSSFLSSTDLEIWGISRRT